ncbi:MAG: hypothetical protein WBZ48_07820 [Bacteroidota bacterium]
MVTKTLLTDAIVQHEAGLHEADDGCGQGAWIHLDAVSCVDEL